MSIDGKINLESSVYEMSNMQSAIDLDNNGSIEHLMNSLDYQQGSMS